MAKIASRARSVYTRNALALLARLIRAARKERQFTEIDLAERAGISRDLLRRIEKGDPRCSIGAVFEVATLVGVDLFNGDEEELSQRLRQAKEKLALLPDRVRKKVKTVDDDF